MPSILKYPKVASTALTQDTYNKLIIDTERLGLSLSAWLRMIITTHYQRPDTGYQYYHIFTTKKQALKLLKQGYELKRSSQDV